MKKIISILIVILGTIGILFDFIFVEFIDSPYTNWDALRLFKYFTIQSNIILVVYFFVLCRSNYFKPGERFMRYIGSVTLSITLTFSIFAIFLQPTWNPTGLQLISSILLHYVTPILAIYYFIKYFKEFQFKKRDSFIWVIYPLLYVLFAMIHGLITSDYIYPFLDINNNSLLFVILFILIAGLIYFGLSLLIVNLNIRKRKTLE